jgi:hypothetical protein
MGLFKNIGKIFGLSGAKHQDPAAAAMPYLNQIPGLGREAYNPFIQQGQQSQQITNPIYSQMAQDPSGFLNQMMNNYSPSEGYRFKEQALSRALGNTAAAGGLSGTQGHQMEQGDMIRGLLGQDQQQYLANLLGIQGQGLQGHEGNIGRGYESAGNLAGYLGNALGAQGGMAFQGVQQQNQYNMDKMRNRSQFWGDIARAVGGAAGGGAFGGGGGGGQQRAGSMFGGGGGGGYSPYAGVTGGGAFQRNPGSWMNAGQGFGGY